MIRDALLFYPCVNYLSKRVRASGVPVRAASDNDYGTYTNRTTLTVNISRNNSATKVTHIFLKCSGVTSYTIEGITRTLPSSVTNQNGRVIPTTRFGFQHDLYELPIVLYGQSYTITFTGDPDIRIYEMMLLELGYTLEIDTRFVSESHRKINRTGVHHTGSTGTLDLSKVRGGKRWNWRSDYSILFPDDDYDVFLRWLEKNPDVVFSQSFENTPTRVYPATVINMDYRAPSRSAVLSEGSFVNFVIEENVGLPLNQITSQDNSAPL